MLMTIRTSEFKSVPSGAYRTVFDSVEPVETSKGKAYRWKWTVSEGPQKGSLISSFSDREYDPSPKNKTGRYLAALAGTSPSDGLAIDPDHYVGKEYTVTVDDAGRVAAFATAN